MTNDMPLSDYLAQGGRLTAPANVPPRYRAELLRIMASFVDSELAASAGFAGAINTAPGVRARIAASRITLEKAQHAERVLALMAEFGTDVARYDSAHDWAARVDRDADLGPDRHGADMRLSLFHYPLAGWTDAVVMNVLMGLATDVQLAELARVSYSPLAETLRDIAPRERRHTGVGLEGLARIVETPGGLAKARASAAYWQPRVAASFGQPGSARFAALAAMGLRHRPNEALLADWQAVTASELSRLGLG